MTDIRDRLIELGRARQEIGRRALRRRQAKQVLNLMGYLLLPTIVVVVLLSM